MERGQWRGVKTIRATGPVLFNVRLVLDFCLCHGFSPLEPDGDETTTRIPELFEPIRPIQAHRPLVKRSTRTDESVS